jgi:phosphate starvation-inducible PhoH-like protein
MTQGKLRVEPGRRIELAERAAQVLFGVHDENLQLLERELRVQISARDQEVFLDGDPESVDTAARILTALGRLAERGREIRVAEIRTAIQVANEQPHLSLEGFFTDIEIPSCKGRSVRPKGPNQRLYLEAIRTHDLVFAVGPAGTGKTFLAMAMAIEALNTRRVRRIILARPAIEAGERLGFLPGDMIEKVNPYLRPLYDALYSLVGFDHASRLIERDQIEIAPLAFMRGRTLSDAFVILDEAQNTTPDQMKMLLTRIGLNSRAVINGDVTQTDLRGDQPSGLVDACGVLAGIEGIAHVEFSRGDVVRHELVKQIVRAYDQQRNANDSGSSKHRND